METFLFPSLMVFLIMKVKIDIHQMKKATADINIIRKHWEAPDQLSLSCLEKLH